MTQPIKLTRRNQLKNLPDFNNLVFGNIYTDHMFIMDYTEGQGWENARIVPYEDFSCAPAMVVFHYGQEIFEGLKAYNREDGSTGLFRSDENWKRMNRSARRMCMPEFDETLAQEALAQLVRLDSRWIPPDFGASLYLRPTMIATDPVIGLKPSKTYRFYIICSPVGPYFKTNGSGLKILVEEKYVRAVPGGTGDAKTGANYAASLIAGREAQQKGYTQVLWLDGIHRKYVEEIGTNNIFFVYGDRVVTPKLNGSILPGITRMSVIDLLRSWDIDVSEETLEIEKITTDIKNGNITESFGSGTAVVISPIGLFGYQGENYTVNDDKIGPITQRVFDELTGIQYGKKDDPFNWTLTL